MDRYVTQTQDKTIISSNHNTKINKSVCLFDQIDGLVQDCSNSIANALEFLQFCTKPPRYTV